MPHSVDLNWWISVIELPVLAALFKLMWDVRREVLSRIEQSDIRNAEIMGRMREDLNGFKLEVARGYVPMQLMREVDRRLSMQLMRIEEKLDVPIRNRTRVEVDEE